MADSNKSSELSTSEPLHPVLVLRPRNLEDVTKLFGLLAIACYALGLVVVSMYLLRLGVSDFSLFRTRFVLAGSAALISMLPGLLLYSLVGMLLSQSWSDLTSMLRALWVSVSTFAVVTAAWSMAWISYVLGIGNYVVWDRIPIPVWLLLLVLAAVMVSTGRLWIQGGLELKPLDLSILEVSEEGELSHREPLSDAQIMPSRQYLLDSLVQATTRRDAAISTLSDLKVQGQSLNAQRRSLNIQTRSLTRALKVYSAMMTVAILTGYLLLFVTNVYPLIPEQFGGGRPRQASLLFSEEGVRAARLIGFDVTHADPLSIQLSVLWESEEEFVVRSADSTGSNQQPVIRVNKSLVNAIIISDTGQPLLSPPPATPQPEASPLSTPSDGRCRHPYGALAAVR